ncbi:MULTISPECIES: EAL domain-containing protein [unclassified Niallia]|uniref:EAL domain-containing protein n=1 Tax=unclassified Niallia TaxID=2837522 RepID=UPI0020421C17|nr:EAL domain-containing protein [Niallia sp. MER 6]MCM3029467.1 EAL domain-containing protein [Niallia sp. MER 6]
MEQNVSAALHKGNEVAVIVFSIHNLAILKREMDSAASQRLWEQVREAFHTVIREEIPSDQIAAVRAYYQDGIALFLKIDHKMDTVPNIDFTIQLILEKLQTKVWRSLQQSVQPIFCTGYIFIDRQIDQLRDAIYLAYQQALSMAQKGLTSEFNEMSFALGKIVANKDIRLLAQPILDVETNKVKACEMLTRGPVGTSLENPLQLFSVARQTNHLYDLEMVVLEKALEQIKLTTWKFDIFINFTPLTLGNQHFVKDLKKLMNKYKEISPNRITIEVTERDSIEGLEYFISNLKLLRLIGFRVAIDDTGAGYASLNSISEIMPDIIKIDRSVIQNIDKNSVKESMLKGLLLIAKEVGSIVVAEGIESAEEALVLSRNKVDLAQGYFYARPTSLSNNLQTIV